MKNNFYLPTTPSCIVQNRKPSTLNPLAYCRVCLLPLKSTLTPLPRCRLDDDAPAYTRTPSTPSLSTYPYNHPSPPHSPYLPPTSGHPDIIPRFSPSQSRPRSYFNDLPPLHDPSYTTSSCISHSKNGSSSALASLRELATALDESPPREHGMWNYMAFAQARTAPTTPGTSWGGGGSYGHSKEYGVSEQTFGGRSVGGGMDRPLPPRGGPPGGYGHRPRSIDLVTPFSGY